MKTEKNINDFIIGIERFERILKQNLINVINPTKNEKHGFNSQERQILQETHDMLIRLRECKMLCEWILDKYDEPFSELKSQTVSI